MQQLGAIDLASGSTPHAPPPHPTQTLVPECGPQSSGAHTDSASTQQPAAATAVPHETAAVGWGLSIYSHAEEAWVQGQVLSWNPRQGQHHVLYEDGEDEWLKLEEEHVRWHQPNSGISHRAGLQKGMLASSIILYQFCTKETWSCPGARYCKTVCLCTSCADCVVLSDLIAVQLVFGLVCS